MVVQEGNGSVWLAPGRISYSDILILYVLCLVDVENVLFITRSAFVMPMQRVSAELITEYKENDNRVREKIWTRKRCLRAYHARAAPVLRTATSYRKK